MSRTFKDQPSWLKQKRRGAIEHDHTRGECHVYSSRSGSYPRRWKHEAKCAKLVTETYTCTKSNPSPEWNLLGWCWMRRYVRAADGSVKFVVTQCLGHKKVTRHDENPCSCDSFPAEPNCYYVSRPGDYGRQSDR